MIKVLLVENQRLLREGIIAILSSTEDIHVIGSTSTGEEAVELIEMEAPDIILMDAQLGEADTIDSTMRIKERDPSIKIIFLSGKPDSKFLITALAAGADGVLMKDLAPERLILSIRDVYNNQVVLTGEAIKEIAQRIEEFGYNRVEMLDYKLKKENILFSKRELDVANLLIDGKKNREMAEMLELTEGTVKNYISSIYSKIGMHQRQQASGYLLSLLD